MIDDWYNPELCVRCGIEFGDGVQSTESSSICSKWITQSTSSSKPSDSEG